METNLMSDPRLLRLHVCMRRKVKIGVQNRRETTHRTHTQNCHEYYQNIFFSLPLSCYWRVSRVFVCVSPSHLLCGGTSPGHTRKIILENFVLSTFFAFLVSYCDRGRVSLSLADFQSNFVSTHETLAFHCSCRSTI